MDGARVMIVEDDATVSAVVVKYLRARGFLVTHHSDGSSAKEALKSGLPDVLILDRMLPGISGDELCRAVREVSDLPIVMLTAMDAVEHRISGLEHGADDYIAKPFSLRELLLRVNGVLRRARPPAALPTPFEVGPFRVDPARRRIAFGLREIGLTTREYELFLYLLQHPEQVLSREDILRDVWDWTFGEASTVTVHVRRLREKIENDPRNPRYLLTEWGAGYRFTVVGS